MNSFYIWSSTPIIPDNGVSSKEFPRIFNVRKSVTIGIKSLWYRRNSMDSWFEGHKHHRVGRWLPREESLVGNYVPSRGGPPTSPRERNRAPGRLMGREISFPAIWKRYILVFAREHAVRGTLFEREAEKRGALAQNSKNGGDGDGKIPLLVIDSRVVEGRERVGSSKRASRARE